MASFTAGHKTDGTTTRGSHHWPGSTAYIIWFAFSGRQWFLKLHNFLVANDYQPSIVDPCIYLRRTVTGFVAIAVYVDDLAIFSSNEQLLRDTKDCLMNRFAMKDLGEISRYLGLEVERTATTFTYHVAP